MTAPPDRIDLATRRGGTKIRDGAVHQHFIPEGWLGVGRSTVLLDGTELAAYDPERMLLELMRSRNKLPYDLYREAVASFRRRSERLDIYRLQDYAESLDQRSGYEVSSSLRQVDYREGLKAVRCPVVIAHGKDDKTRTLAHVEMMTSSMPHAEVFLLEGGHTIMVENKPGWQRALDHLMEKVLAAQENP